MDDDETEAGSSSVTLSHRAGSSPAVPDLQTALGDRIGRYEVSRRVGVGGMGVVYAAFDPKLDRTVALKVLQPGAYANGGSLGRERLLREAKAMAQLSHPNVIAVHDVGVADGRVFVAMEFIDGPTLDMWCETHADDYRGIIATYRDAGRGLAAAHAAGLIHRDFKPKNVMVDAEGRARVLDFGLARGVETLPSSDAVEELELSTFDQRMTLTGGVVGTPRFMSPEQWSGEPIDARSDQFSFCVALYESLYGQRPFEASSAMELMARVCRGTVVSPPSDRGVPIRVWRVLRRGLAADPAGRYPDMLALLNALDLRRVVRRRRFVVAAAAVSLAVGGAYVFGAQRATPTQTACKSVDEFALQLWSEADAAALDTALASATQQHQAAVSRGVTARLDAWAQTWAVGKRGACEATHLRGEQSEALLDLRTDCYARAGLRFNAFVQLLVARPATLEGAATMTLPDVAVCADTQWLTDARPIPSGVDTQRKIEEGHASVSGAQLLYHAGELTEAHGLASEALRVALAAEYTPLVAEARLLLARIQFAEGDIVDAEAMMSMAMTDALAADDSWTAAESAILLIDFVGLGGKRAEERRRWERVAEGIVAKLGDPPALLGRLAISRSGALRVDGEAEQALAAARDGLAQYSEAFGPDDSRTANAHDAVGVALQNLGRAEEGLEHLERALEIERQQWGNGHPRVAGSLGNLGIVYGSLGRVEDCAEALEAGLAIEEAVYGMQSIQLVQALTNLGEVRAMQTRYEEQLQLNDRALEIRERVYGRDHVEASINLTNGGSALTQLDRFDEATPRLQRALQIRLAHYGPDHPATALTQLYLGMALAGEQRLDEATAATGEALRIWTATFGEAHPNVGASMVTLGEQEVGAGRTAQGMRRMNAGLAVLIAAVGEDHPDVETARAQIAAAKGSK